MSAPYLTDEEIARITHPLKQGAARCRYFQKLAIKVDPRPDGQPLVGRAEFEAARMARGRSAPPVPVSSDCPTANFDALDRIGTRRLRAV